MGFVILIWIFHLFHIDFSFYGSHTQKVIIIIIASKRTRIYLQKKKQWQRKRIIFYCLVGWEKKERHQQNKNRKPECKSKRDNCLKRKKKNRNLNVLLFMFASLTSLYCIYLYYGIGECVLKRTYNKILLLYFDFSKENIAIHTNIRRDRRELHI